MTVAPGEIKIKNKLDDIQHAAKEKASASTHSMNDVIHSILVLNQALQKHKEAMHFVVNKE